MQKGNFNMPKVSIITVCYNAEKTINRTLKSVGMQSYKDYEHIIVDGQSRDKTIDIVRKYCASGGGREVNICI